MSENTRLEDLINGADLGADACLTVHYKHGKGYFIQVQDYCSSAFSAGGYGDTIAEAITMLEREMAGDGPSADMPDWVDALADIG